LSIRPISSIDTIDKNEPDDIFICSISFEERCINVVEHLADNYVARKSLVVRYSAKNEAGLREKNQKLICDTLPHHIQNKKSILPIYFDKYNPYSFWHLLEEWFSGLKSVKKITIDITTFTKSYLLTLLKLIKTKYPRAKIRVLYTMGIYPENEPLTRGVKDIVILPYYGGFELCKKKSILILLMGYEAERAYSIWETIDPVQTIAIIGNPPSYLGANGPSRKLNQAILDDPDTIVDEVSAIDPIKTMDKIYEIYKKREYKDFSFFIAPLGTKMQVIGIYLFFEKLAPVTNVQIIYAYPAKYNEKKYTLDFERDKVWEFYLPNN
jgi:hypothetical protein